MAFFAEIDSDNVVTQVLVVDDEKILDESGEVSEALGIAHLRNVFENDSNWLLCDSTGVYRKNFPAVNSTYDQVNDAFILEQPYPSWVLNETTFQWEAPVSCPGSTDDYYWNEDLGQWAERVKTEPAYLS